MYILQAIIIKNQFNTPPPPCQFEGTELIKQGKCLAGSLQRSSLKVAINQNQGGGAFPAASTYIYKFFATSASTTPRLQARSERSRSENLYMYVEAAGKTPPPVRITLLNY